MSNSRRVLVVDDDTFLRMLVSIELPEWEVLEADRVHEAMRMAVEHLPDAVLVDIRLPDGDGTELVRSLRADASTAHIPVLVVTAGHDEANRPELLAAGADEYLPKPIEPADLMARLERLMDIEPEARRHRRRDLLERLAEGAEGDPDPIGSSTTGVEPDEPEPRRPRRGINLRRVLGGD